MAEPSLKELVELIKWRSVQAKENCIAKDKYIHERLIHLGNLSYGHRSGI